jgi:hypothetical protein
MEEWSLCQSRGKERDVEENILLLENIETLALASRSKIRSNGEYQKAFNKQTIAHSFMKPHIDFRLSVMYSNALLLYSIPSIPHLLLGRGLPILQLKTSPLSLDGGENVIPPTYFCLHDPLAIRRLLLCQLLYQDGYSWM